MNKFIPVFAAILIGIFAAAAFGQPSPVSPTSNLLEVYLAKDDGTGHPGDASELFSTTDVPIYCVVLLNSVDPTKVSMSFVAAEVAGIKAGTKVVTTTYTTKQGENRVNFTGRPEKLWIVGKYRVDIYIDGKFEKSSEFLISKPGTAGRSETFAEKSKPSRPRIQ